MRKNGFYPNFYSGFLEIKMINIVPAISVRVNIVPYRRVSLESQVGLDLWLKRPYFGEWLSSRVE